MPAGARILLLDVMDCLVHDPFYVEVLDFFGLELEALFAIKSKSAWVEFECGRLSREQMRERYFEDGRALDLEGLETCMRESYRFMPGIEDLLDDLLRAGYELHALSNYPIWYELIEAELALSRWLRWSFVSCKTQHRKPDPEVYTGAARALGRAPEQLVFVDDREKNCAAARACGLEALRFRDAASLRAELATLGIST